MQTILLHYGIRTDRFDTVALRKAREVLDVYTASLRMISSGAERNQQLNA